MTEENVNPQVTSLQHSNIRPLHLGAERYRSRVTTIEKFPAELADDVEINLEAGKFLGEDQQYLATRDFILSAVGLTVPYRLEQQPNSKNILTPAIFGRSVAPAFGRIPYAGLMGSQILFKGVGMSGDHYPDNEGEKHLFQGVWTNPINPTGYLIQSENNVDVHVSNELLNEGGRSSLNLGTIVLNEGNVKRHIEGTWGKYDKNVGRVMIKALENRQDTDSRMVISARVGGVAQRLELLLPYMQFALGPKSPNLYLENLIRANIRHGARLLREESRTFPDSFSRYLTASKITDAQQTLGTIANGKSLESKDLDVLSEIITGMAVTDRK